MAGDVGVSGADVPRALREIDMAVEKGSAFLLKVGNGAATVVYSTVAGLRTTQMSVNGEATAGASCSMWG